MPAIRRPHVAAAGLLAAVSLLAGAWTASAEEQVDIMELAETEIGQHDFEKGTLDGAPTDDLPDHIVRLPVVLPNGRNPQRADWSPDGRRLIFLDAPLGNVWEYDLGSGRTTNLTGTYVPDRVLRAHHLSNGDLLLCIAPEGGGRFDGELHVLPRRRPSPDRRSSRRPLGTTGPIALGEECWEGLAVSKRSGSLRIAWNRSSIDFTKVPDVFVQAAIGQSQIMVGRIAYGEDGTPRLADKTLAVDKRDVGPDASVEAQDFFNGDRELVFSAYGHNGGQVMSVDLETRRITDQSRSPWYEEPEGVDPAGGYVLVERDLSIMVFPGELDIWQLRLDGSGNFRRVTTFNHYKGYGATNPVVSPDGSRIAFQMEKAGSEHGEGHGLFLFNLSDWAPPAYAPDPFLTPQRP